MDDMVGSGVSDQLSVIGVQWKIDHPKKAAFTQRRKGAKIFQSVSCAMPFT
jgi:hypothetical protein